MVDREKSHLSIENKLHFYRVVTKPVCTYGIELWDFASTSNIIIMQGSQSNILRAISLHPGMKQIILCIQTSTSLT
jgi:hypothetical protein